MGQEYVPAIDIWVPDTDVFTDALTSANPGDISIVIHKTACNSPCTAQDVANDFQSSSPGPSTHFIVGLDGTVVQCVHLKDGAGGNCCLEQGHDSYWDRYSATYGNLNRCTISIEHVDQTVDNSQPMTSIQVQASHALVAWLCKQYSIPTSRIKGHNTLDPITKARCPGPTYDFQALFAQINSQGVNKNMERQFDNVWLAGVGAYKSGIYQIAKQAFLADKMSACMPLSSEISTVDWSGHAIIYQPFSNGCHAEYASGSATIYDGFNHAVYHGSIA